MILILGSSKDDILYFETKMREKKYEHFYKNATIITGLLSGQQVCVAFGINTNYLSSTFVTTIIDHHPSIIVAINVGLARSLSTDLKPRDILVSEAIVLGDVNQTNQFRVQLCEIPGISQFLSSDIYLKNVCEKTSSLLNLHNVHFGTVISTNNYYDNVKEFSFIGQDRMILGQTQFLAVDCEAGGFAVACAFAGIPFVSIKVIQYVIGEDQFNRNNLINALEEYVNVGKLVTAIISEICRNETITL